MAYKRKTKLTFDFEAAVSKLMLQVNGCLTQAGRLQSAIDILRGTASLPTVRKRRSRKVKATKRHGKRRMSATGRKRIAQAQRRRWKLFKQVEAEKAARRATRKAA